MQVNVWDCTAIRWSRTKIIVIQNKQSNTNKINFQNVKLQPQSLIKIHECLYSEDLTSVPPTPTNANTPPTSIFSEDCTF